MVPGGLGAVAVAAQARDGLGAKIIDVLARCALGIAESLERPLRESRRSPLMDGRGGSSDSA